MPFDDRTAQQLAVVQSSKGHSIRFATARSRLAHPYLQLRGVRCAASQTAAVSNPSNPSMTAPVRAVPRSHPLREAIAADPETVVSAIEPLVLMSGKHKRMVERCDMADHSHSHTHGEIEHSHPHSHDDPHHQHSHPPGSTPQDPHEQHTHEHTHEKLTHSHEHDHDDPDHRHEH